MSCRVDEKKRQHIFVNSSVNTPTRQFIIYEKIFTRGGHLVGHRGIYGFYASCHWRYYAFDGFGLVDYRVGSDKRHLAAYERSGMARKF